MTPSGENPRGLLEGEDSASDPLTASMNDQLQQAIASTIGQEALNTEESLGRDVLKTIPNYF